MPYKHKDAWHRAARQFMAQASIGEVSRYRYQLWLEHSGTCLGFPVPSSLNLAQLRKLETTIPGGESCKAVHLSVTRAFLIFAGCKAARSWKFPYRIRTKTNGVFLSEVDVATIRPHARSKGIDTELFYSLAVDNGLRVVDMRRLTMANAHELITSGHSTILGKGRGGGKPGHLELSKMTMRPLSQYLAMRQEWARTAVKDSDRLLVRPMSGELLPVSYDIIADRLTALSEASGIYFRPHDLRRTYGHRLHLAGVPIETIAKLMRHDSINQSFRAYIGILGDELREAQDRLSRDP